MSIFWSIVKGLNNVLTNSLRSFETNENEEVSNTNRRDELRDEWVERLYDCTDVEINRYCDWYRLYRSVEENGRYKCIHTIAEYCADRGIEFYYRYY